MDRGVFRIVNTEDMLAAFPQAAGARAPSHAPRGVPAGRGLGRSGGGPRPLPPGLGRPASVRLVPAKKNLPLS